MQRFAIETWMNWHDGGRLQQGINCRDLPLGGVYDDSLAATWQAHSALGEGFVDIYALEYIGTPQTMNNFGVAINNSKVPCCIMADCTLMQEAGLDPLRTIGLALAKYSKHANYAQVGGKPVLVLYNPQSVNAYRNTWPKIIKLVFPAFFVIADVGGIPAITQVGSPQPTLDDYASAADALFHWGIAGLLNSGGALDGAYRLTSTAATRVGKPFGMTIQSQFDNTLLNKPGLFVPKYDVATGISNMWRSWRSGVDANASFIHGVADEFHENQVLIPSQLQGYAAYEDWRAAVQAFKTYRQ